MELCFTFLHIPSFGPFGLKGVTAHMSANTAVTGEVLPIELQLFPAG